MVFVRYYLISELTPDLEDEDDVINCTSGKKV